MIENFWKIVSEVLYFVNNPLCTYNSRNWHTLQSQPDVKMSLKNEKKRKFLIIVATNIFCEYHLSAKEAWGQ